jgi:hypothetical protein
MSHPTISEAATAMTKRSAAEMRVFREAIDRSEFFAGAQAR